MERQLANLTGLVQKALTQPATHLQVPSGRDGYRTGNILMIFLRKTNSVNFAVLVHHFVLVVMALA